MLTSRTIAFNEEMGPLIFCTLIIFFPYGAFVIHVKDLLKKLNIEEIYRRLISSQLIGMVASILIWGLLKYTAYSNREGGADMGGAFIFMFISPLIVFQLMKLPFAILKINNSTFGDDSLKNF